MNEMHLSDIEKRAATLLPSPQDWRTVTEIAAAASGAGLTGCTRAQTAAIKILLGLEHGITPGVALQEIYLMEGKLALSATMQLALLMRRGIAKYEIQELSDTSVTVKMTRTDTDQSRCFELTIEEAKAKGYLTSTKGTLKTNWKNHPADMMFHRCITRAVKLMFPDLFAGIGYIPDELGADTDASGSPLAGYTFEPNAHATQEGLAQPGLAPISQASSPAVVDDAPPIQPLPGLRPTDPPASPAPSVPATPAPELPPIEQTKASITRSVSALKSASIITSTQQWQDYLLARTQGRAKSIQQLEPLELQSLSTALDAIERITILDDGHGIPAILTAKSQTSLLNLTDEELFAIRDEMTKKKTPF